METQHEAKTRKIGVRFILVWAFGLLFIAGGFVQVIMHLSTPGFGLMYVLAGLIIFPPFWQFVKTKWNFELSGVLKVILFFIALFLGGSLFSSSIVSNTATKTQNTANTSVQQQDTPTEVPTAAPTPIVVDATVLVKEYDKNKLAAQDKYTGKQVETTAFIDNISQDVMGSYFLSLKPSDDKYYFGTSIQCFFKDKSVLTSLAKEQSVTVQGTAGDMTLGIVVMKDCSIVK